MKKRSYPIDCFFGSKSRDHDTTATTWVWVCVCCCSFGSFSSGGDGSSVLGEGEALSRKEIDALLRYVDGDGDGQIDCRELERALARARKTPDSEHAAIQAMLISRLEAALHKNGGIKLAEVFAALDADGSGEIDVDELKNGCVVSRAHLSSRRRRRRREVARPRGVVGRFQARGSRGFRREPN